MVTSPQTTGTANRQRTTSRAARVMTACPRTGNQPADTLGNYLELVPAKAAFEIPHRQSGGAVTAILSECT